MGIECPDRRGDHPREGVLQVVQPGRAVTAVSDVGDGVPAVVGEAITQRREQGRPAQEQATVSVTRRDGLIAWLDAGPRPGVRVVPVGPFPVHGRALGRVVTRTEALKAI